MRSNGDQHLRQTIKDLHQLEEVLDRTIRATRFFRLGGAIPDATLLLEKSTELTRVSGEMRIAADALISRAKSVARRYPNRPPRELRPGRFAGGQGKGLPQEIHALARRVCKKTDILSDQVSQLRNHARTEVNKPDRWGDLAAATDVTALWGIINTAIELLRKCIERSRTRPGK